ncbi:MAG: stage III sporulation protein AD [Firmicutes bacterium]|nr:stage III sporulation protein AD [Bacillota bacterium]
MGDIAGVVVLAIIVSVFILYIKERDYPEYALLLGALFLVITLLRLVSPLAQLISVFTQVSQQAGINSYYSDIILRSMAVAYIASFGTELSKDAGQSAIGMVIELGAKIIILALGIPILLAIIKTLAEIIG